MRRVNVCSEMSLSQEVIERFQQFQELADAGLVAYGSKITEQEAEFTVLPFGRWNLRKVVPVNEMESALLYQEGRNDVSWFGTSTLVKVNEDYYEDAVRAKIFVFADGREVDLINDMEGQNAYFEFFLLYEPPDANTTVNGWRRVSGSGLTARDLIRIPNDQ